MPTIRQQIMAWLECGPHSARDLSGRVGIAEKEVPLHLAHIDRSLAGKGRKLDIISAGCQACGFAFTSKKRYNRPSRCPRCRSERTTEPVFQIRPR
ncbi:MAG: transcriptional regulator [Pseudomonadota bacterium]